VRARCGYSHTRPRDTLVRHEQRLAPSTISSLRRDGCARTAVHLGQRSAERRRGS